MTIFHWNSLRREYEIVNKEMKMVEITYNPFQRRIQYSTSFPSGHNLSYEYLLMVYASRMWSLLSSSMADRLIPLRLILVVALCS